MVGLTSAVHWWEEWQLRVLVLTSLAIQFFLFCFPYLRVRAIPGRLRFIMWLAYHAGDAVAIYTLATLFNRHKGQGDGGVGGGHSTNTLLEVVWAPVLLIHLAGYDGVTAYNIEDNELWSRHLLTAVSQIIVAVYVFCKSCPPGGDKRLLQAVILLFILGVVKCFFKAFAFKRACIYSLVSSAAAKQINHCNMCNELEEYVKHARGIVVRQETEDHQVVEKDPRRRESVEGRGEASKLFVDLSSPYSRRIIIFKKFWGIREERAHAWVQAGVANAFLLLYTRLKTVLPVQTSNNVGGAQLTSILFTLYLRPLVPWATIVLFHHSHREAYNGIDVKVTYAILCCTAALEFYSFGTIVATKIKTNLPRHDGSFHGPQQETRHNCVENISFREVWPQTVAQYSLVGYFVRNKKHNIMMGIVSFLQCKDFLDQFWCMEPCSSSAEITHLVLGYLEAGWKNEIEDAATYRSFNNHCSFSNHYTFNKHCNHRGFKRNRPFDESVLIWHLATEFCFFSTFPKEPEPGVEIIIQGASEMVPAVKGVSVAKNPTSTTNTPQCSEEFDDCKAVQCRQMSNYMVYLLFVNPEMLLPGSRRYLFKSAYGELKDILRDSKWNPVCRSRYTPCVGVKLMEEEAIVMDRLIRVMQQKSKRRPSQEESSKEAIVTDTIITVAPLKSERSSQEESSTEASNKEEKFIDEAWALAQGLLKMGEKQRWEVIQGVWVEMLCFSASRCRGYLHAKVLGKGGEFLSYAWLLLFYMGMETFSERLQRELLPDFQGNFHNGTAPTPTSEVSTTGADAPSASEVHTHAGAGAAPSSTSKICMA